MSDAGRVAPGLTVDRYYVEALLGEGGMASVWRVRHVVLDSGHALKVLRPELVVRPELRERFLSEGRIQAQIRHPNIAAVTDVVAEDGIAGLVMELLVGRSLEQRLAEEGPLAPAEVLDVFLPALDALAWAHDHGVVHRDLKPANLFLAAGTRGRIRPVVLDFGVARLRDEARVAGGRTLLTQAGARVGTVHYMSPEQVRDPRDVDGRSDVFAMGATLYEALLGRPAFPGETEFEVQQRIVEGHLADPGAGLPREAAALADVVRRALAVRREDRFQDALALADALTLAIRGAANPPAWAVARASPAPPPPRSDPPAPPRPEPRKIEVAPRPARPAEAWLERVGGERVALGEVAMVLNPLRGTVEPVPRGGVRFSHARVVRAGDAWWVEPHGVAPAVTIDGQRLMAARQLRGGERIRVEPHEFVFRAAEPTM
jgi:serine/threonine protein kinase